MLRFTAEHFELKCSRAAPKFVFRSKPTQAEPSAPTYTNSWGYCPRLVSRRAVGAKDNFSENPFQNRTPLLSLRRPPDREILQLDGIPQIHLLFDSGPIGIDRRHPKLE